MTSGGEVPLAGGRVTDGVVRVGNTVRRPRGPRAPFVEELLRHLELRGFDGAPRFLGIDARGRQILSYLDGEIPSETWAAVFPDARVASAARLLRRYHDAIAGSALADGAEVVCHGDPGAWNMVWRGEDAVALIDFDEAAAGARLDDLGYLAWKHLNLGTVPLPVGEQARQLVVLASAYGTDAPAARLVAAVEDAQARIERKGRAERWSAEAMRYLGEERRWLATHAPLLVDAA